MLHKKMLLFGLVGLINTGVDWAGFWLLGMLLPNTVVAVWSAKAGSYALGVLSSFVLNSRLTFKDEVQELANSGTLNHTWLFTRFVIVSLLCLVLNSSAYMYLAGSEYMQFLPLLAATAISYVVGFSLNHLWTYRGRGVS